MSEPEQTTITIEQVEQPPPPVTPSTSTPSSSPSASSSSSSHLSASPITSSSPSSLSIYASCANSPLVHSQSIPTPPETPSTLRAHSIPKCVYILRGLPGSGKSVTSNGLLTQTQAHINSLLTTPATSV